MKAVAFTLVFFALAAFAPLRADFEPPVPVRTSAPVFPYELRHDGISGVVLVNCLIDAQGNVTDMKVVKSTHDAFVEPAIAALKKWKFKPAQRDGNSVPVRVSIPIKFTIEDS